MCIGVSNLRRGLFGFFSLILHPGVLCLPRYRKFVETPWGLNRACRIQHPCFALPFCRRRICVLWFEGLEWYISLWENSVHADRICWPDEERPLLLRTKGMELQVQNGYQRRVGTSQSVRLFPNWKSRSRMVVCCTQNRNQYMSATPPHFSCSPENRQCRLRDGL